MKTSPLFLRRGRTASGMTLVELLCAMGLMVVALGAAFVTFIGIQRSLATSLYQVNAQGDQNRVFSYLRRDLRGASNVQIASQGTQVTITVPTQTAPTLNLNLGLSLLSLLAPPSTSPTASDTIRYYRQGTSVIRELNGAPTQLTDSATLFQVNLSGTIMQITAAFQPRYSLANRPANSAATTTNVYVHLLNASAQ